MLSEIETTEARRLSALKRARLHVGLWSSRHCIAVLRICIGAVYLWFGALKFIAGASPAELLAIRTISALTFSVMSSRAVLTSLAIWECGIGVSLITARFLPLALIAIYVHLTGTLAALFLFPSDLFTHIPYAPTLEGQYIIKNVILIAGATVLAAAAERNVGRR